MEQPKALLDFHGKSVIQRILGNMASVCNRIVVVLGYHSESLLQHLEDFEAPVVLEFTSNPEPENGMFSSLRTGINGLKPNARFLLHMVDQPHISPAFYPELASLDDPGFDWVQPLFANRAGHPLILGGKLPEIIRNAPAGSTLRDLSTSGEVKALQLPMDYPEILLNMNTPQDYEQLLQLGEQNGR